MDSNQDTGSSSSTANSSNDSSKSRRSQQTYSQMAAQNPALREMYEILDRMKRRNRQSKVLVEMDLVPFDDSVWSLEEMCLDVIKRNGAPDSRGSKLK